MVSSSSSALHAKDSASAWNSADIARRRPAPVDVFLERDALSARARPRRRGVSAAPAHEQRRALPVAGSFVEEALLRLRQVQRHEHSRALLRDIHAGDAVARGLRAVAIHERLQRGERAGGVLERVRGGLYALGVVAIGGAPELGPRAPEVEHCRRALEPRRGHHRAFPRVECVRPSEGKVHVPALLAHGEAALHDAQGAEVRQERLAPLLGRLRTARRDNLRAEQGERLEVLLRFLRLLRGKGSSMYARLGPAMSMSSPDVSRSGAKGGDLVSVVSSDCAMPQRPRPAVREKQDGGERPVGPAARTSFGMMPSITPLLILLSAMMAAVRADDAGVF